MCCDYKDLEIAIKLNFILVRSLGRFIADFMSKNYKFLNLRVSGKTDKNRPKFYCVMHYRIETSDNIFP